MVQLNFTQRCAPHFNGEKHLPHSQPIFLKASGASAFRYGRVTGELEPDSAKRQHVLVITRRSLKR